MPDDEFYQILYHLETQDIKILCVYGISTLANLIKNKT